MQYMISFIIFWIIYLLFQTACVFLSLFDFDLTDTAMAI